MDLLSLVLTLRPQASPVPDKPPPLWWGRAAHALLLEVVRQSDDVLAAGVHDSKDGPLPFTASTLLGFSSRKGLEKNHSYSLRLASIQLQVSDILLRAAQAGGKFTPGSVFELDYVPFEVQSAAWQAGEHPWAGSDSYQELSAPFLLGQKQPPRQVTLEFTSPTTFKSGGKHVPIPLPGLVFGSLLEKWNSHAPIAFPEETKRYAEECLAVSRYRLSTRAVLVKSSGLRVGAVGEITYTCLNYDRYWMSVVAVLAEFALYAGVGAGGGMGLGQCRAIHPLSQSEESDQSVRFEMPVN